MDEELELHIYKNEREFYHQFPSRFYICSNCGYMNFSKYVCQKCGWRADGLLKTWGKGFKYSILDKGITEEIFKPVELEKGKENGR